MKQYTLDELNTFVVVEPTLKPKPIIIPNAEKGDNQIKKDYTDTAGDESRFYSFLPLVTINDGYRVSPSNIMKFELDFTRFLPSLHIKIADNNSELKSKYYPTDGSIIGIYIAPTGEDGTYKPIRMDFIITSVSEDTMIPGTVHVDFANEFDIYADMNIPELFYIKNCYESGTSWEAIKSIAEQSGLGFASNVENTNDSQVWLNSYNSVKSFIQNISQHSFLDDESFFVSFVDGYYNLNLVEVSRLFSQNPENEKCWTYSTAFYQEDHADENAEEDTVDEESEVLNAWVGRRHKWWYELNNSRYLSGWSLYFDDYKQINSGSSSLFDGYVKYLQSWDWCERKKIELPLSVENPGTEGMLPLNKGHFVNGEPSELSQNLVSYTYAGETNEHMNPEYYFAESNNKLNISDMSKFGLTIELPCFNPAITKYSRIKVIVFEKNDCAQSGLIEDKNRTSDSTLENENGEELKLSEHPELQSDTTPRFDLSTEDGIEQAKTAGVYSELATQGADQEKNEARETLNESVSGWYVVTGYEIYMNDINEDGVSRLKQKVYLSRREHKPAIKANYEKINK